MQGKDGGFEEENFKTKEKDGRIGLTKHFCIQNTAEIFPASSGGARTMSNELNVEFLGSIPLDPLLARCCDEGKNFLTEMPDSPTISALNEICKSKFSIYFVRKYLIFHEYKTKEKFCFQVLFESVKKRKRTVPIIPNNTSCV